jgi:hypothetical protein
MEQWDSNSNLLGDKLSIYQKQLWYVHIKEYYSKVKMSKLALHR